MQWKNRQTDRPTTLDRSIWTMYTLSQYAQLGYTPAPNDAVRRVAEIHGGNCTPPVEVSAKFHAVIDTEIDSAAPQECHVGLLFSLT